MQGLLAFSSGVAVVCFLPVLPGRGVLLLLALLGALALFRVTRPIGLAALGLAYGILHGQWALERRLPEILEGVDLTAVGVIDSIPERHERRLSFWFKPERLGQLEPAQLPRRIKLSWYGDAPPLHAGDRWEFTVRLKRPHGLMNPGGFDYESWLFSQRIDATGYVRPYPPAVALQGELTLHRLRQALSDRLHERLRGYDSAGIVIALVVGDRRFIGDDQWEVLRRTGTSHLVAISGLHVVLLATAVGWLVNRAWRRLPGLCERLPARTLAVAAGGGAAAVYAALAGFALPTQRALIMLAVPLLALGLGRSLRPAWALALALAGVLAWDPFAPLSPGFWLSFGAVTVLLMLALERSAQPWWWRLSRTQCLLSAALIPITLVWFSAASWISPVANLPAIVVVGWVIVPLSMLGSVQELIFPGSVPLLPLAAWLCDWLMTALAALSRPEWAASSLPAPPWGVAVAGILGVVLMLVPRGISLRLLGAVLLSLMLLVRPPRPPAGEAWVTVLDVGQGTAVVVESARRVLVYDAGPGGAYAMDAGTAALVPFLVHRGYARLDQVVVSHADSDHAGGLGALLAAFPGAPVAAGEELPALDHERGCRAGERWEWDGVVFSFLWPADGADVRGNDASCVLRVEVGAGAVLLAGDIEQVSEASLVAAQAERLRAQLLLVPHHGSRTSSTEAFVAAVAPTWAVVTTGRRNRWGFPKPEVQARYQAAGAQVLRTDETGALRLRLHGDGVDLLERHRQRRMRYFHSRYGS